MSAARWRLKVSSGVSGSTVSVLSVASPSCASRIRLSPSSRNRFTGDTSILSASSSACSRRHPLISVWIAVRFARARRSTYDVDTRFPASSSTKPSFIQSRSLSIGWVG